jgi:hypothetical protein
MKRFIGLCMTVVGAAMVLWGGYYVLTGQSSQTLHVADGFAVTAMVGGLAGVAVFTLGLVWVRD